MTFSSDHELPFPGHSPASASLLPHPSLDLNARNARQDPLRQVSPNVPLLFTATLASPGAKLSSPVTAQAGIHFGGLQPVTRLGEFSANQRSLLPFAASPSSCFAAFGELADISRLGELPTEDDLLLMFFDQAPEGARMQQPSLQFLPPAAAAVAAAHHWPSENHRFGAHHLRQPILHPQPNHSSPHQQQSYPIFDPALLAIPSLGQMAAAKPSEAADDPARPKRRAPMDSYPPQLRHRRRTRLASTDCEEDEEAEDDDSEEERMPAPKARGPRPAPVPRQAAAAPAAAAAAVDNMAGTGQTFRGVSRHRLTQRWEASLWLSGRQLYLGGFDAQVDAAQAYDLAALACKGLDAVINFSPADYEAQLKEIEGFSREEVVAYVRRRSAAFSRGKSKYRGVSGQNGRWEARIGSFGGRKNVSFGIFESEECAARQYDRALILEKGRSAKTNFPLRDYEAEVATYKLHLSRVCGGMSRTSSAAVREMQTYTLPTDRVNTVDEKKRSAIIYGEALRQALEGK